MDEDFQLSNLNEIFKIFGKNWHTLHHCKMTDSLQLIFEFQAHKVIQKKIKTVHICLLKYR